MASVFAQSWSRDMPSDIETSPLRVRMRPMNRYESRECESKLPAAECRSVLIAHDLENLLFLEKSPVGW